LFPLALTCEFKPGLDQLQLVMLRFQSASIANLLLGLREETLLQAPIGQRQMRIARWRIDSLSPLNVGILQRRGHKKYVIGGDMRLARPAREHVSITISDYSATHDAAVLEHHNLLLGVAHFINRVWRCRFNRPWLSRPFHRFVSFRPQAANNGQRNRQRDPKPGFIVNNRSHRGEE
jgi:hypothetical protein